MHYTVQYSGGVCSWFAAKTIIEEHGSENVTLLFADVKMEDEDLYRFLDETSKDLGVPLTVISDGRTPWEVFWDVRYMGNSRVDPCSMILKRELLDKWHNENSDPWDTTIVVGLSADEQDRFKTFSRRMLEKGWYVSAPAAAKGVSKADMIQALRDRGIEPPELYADGFPHNNCGGFCVKMGIGQAILLLKKRPATYRFHEQKEREFREFIGQDVSILKDRRGGVVRSLTLERLRGMVEAGEICLVGGDMGGCGCAID